MAIRPAPMGQCTKKCRCLLGANQGLAYDCNQPCESGYTFSADVCDCFPDNDTLCTNGTIYITSYLSLSQGTMETVTTFYPGTSGYLANGPLRVVDNSVQGWDGTTWNELITAPWTRGDEYNGVTVTNAIHTAVTTSNCN